MKVRIQLRLDVPKMNIPEEFVTSLEALADSKKYSDAVFEKLVTLTFDILIRSKTEQHLAGMVPLTVSLIPDW